MDINLQLTCELLRICKKYNNNTLNNTCFRCTLLPPKDSSSSSPATKYIFSFAYYLNYLSKIFECLSKTFEIMEGKNYISIKITILIIGYVSKNRIYYIGLDIIDIILVYYITDLFALIFSVIFRNHVSWLEHHL